MTPDRPLQVWLVDDSPTDRLLAEEAFAQVGADCTLSTLASGPDTLTALHTPGVALPSVLLLDLNMPGMNGLEVLSVLKAHHTFRYIPVIMLTTSQNEQDIQQAYQQRASAYVIKPVRFEDFLQQVEGFVAFWSRAQLVTRR
ncbi:response regulator [Deinococcus sp. QL22]|uniref:response regulator n=1 Tax=Deinococcus sp. QL22 TaxID=2939437 RepID=UPI002016ED5C|nr:response regulator [Deinococcus sp. QL22]UQN08523.1 response regulator [Deinococcus sp. QL22]